MKAPVIILGLICAALAYGYYKSYSGAQDDAAAAAKEHQSLSNQVAELRTKLALEQGTATIAESNHQYTVNRRTAELLNASNRLVQANLLLNSSQAEGRTAQTDLQGKAAQIAVLEAQRDDLSRKLEVIPTLQKQLTETKERMETSTGDRDFLFLEVRRLQVEKAEVVTKLEDPAFLRLQLAKAEEDFEMRRRLAKAGANAPVDRRARLELQRDGTVRPVTVAKQAQK